MTTLILQAAGSALGGIAGGPIGAAAGRALGGLAGAALDGALFGGDSPRRVEGPRLADMEGLTSSEGAPIPRVYGRARIGGQLIWATRFEEVASAATERAPGGGKGGGRRAATVTTSYAYFANLAVGLCEGPIAFVRRVWADGRELDLTTVTLRVHRGFATQAADPLVVAKEGAENAPAYRNLAYVVFERLPLADFGNRVPQFSFEVVRPVDGLPAMLRGVCLIPGASEFGYDPLPVTQVLGAGWTRPDNRHQLQHPSDVVASLDALQSLCPNLARVALVVSWFGDDLRAGHCTIAPRVEVTVKTTYDAVWSVAGLDRATARAVSLAGGAPAYGGTPSDDGIVRLIRHLKARGLEVVLYPFVMMDVAAGNSLPDPHGGGTQPAYPWRGRVTCHPAPGRPGSPDGTAAAADQVADFFGTALPTDFAIEGERVVYSGPDEWSFRRHIMHCAHLAVAAGGVDGFILGSELVGLTRVRSAPGEYPAVAALKALAAHVRAVVGPATAITYAADWTEYGAHVRDGGAEVRFPLDPLWADPAIDAVGIDWYPPLSDWRDGPDNADGAETRGIHDVAYLRRRVTGGEAFDWFYAGAAERDAQLRTPITDGAYGKPWTFRAKDLLGWWSHQHVERVGGIETAATAWVPEGKPIWLTEIGVPAVDKGPNAPNLFPDPKSSESGLPPFSHGGRDDLVQARALEATLSRFDPALPGHSPGANPVSTVYGGRMIDPGHVFAWAWDARPFPAFPDFDLVWADGRNWQTGHWLTGRLEGLPLDRLIAAILADFGLPHGDPDAVDGFVDGYVVDRPMSARGALEPLARLFGIDAVAGGGVLRWQGRRDGSVATLGPADLVEVERQPLLHCVRSQETELPHQIELGFTDGEGEYRRATVASRRLAGSSRRETRADLAVVGRRAAMQGLAESWLQDLWAARDTVEFAVPPARVDLEPGDVVAVPTASGPRLCRIVRIVDGPSRRVSARAVEPAVFAIPAAPAVPPFRPPPRIAGRPAVVVLDLPATDGDPPALQHLAVAADPWPDSVAIWRSGDGAGFALHRIVSLGAMIGHTLTPLLPGPLWRWDQAAVLDVELSSGALASITDAAALAGGNVFAVHGPDARWEILAAARAELVGTRRWRLTRLLRGLAGSEPEAARPAGSGAVIVRLDAGVTALTNALADLGRTWRYRIGPADRDHSDPAYAEIVTAATAEALRPLAPVRVSARRGPDGVLIRWLRRTRREGDAWEPVEVPLAEELERYEVDVVHGSAVVRTFSVEAPQVLYPAAAELADFGSVQTALTLRVAQVSTAVGQGFVRDATVPVL